MFFKKKTTVQKLRERPEWYVRELPEEIFVPALDGHRPDDMTVALEDATLDDLAFAIVGTALLLDKSPARSQAVAPQRVALAEAPAAGVRSVDAPRTPLPISAALSAPSICAALGLAERRRSVESKVSTPADKCASTLSR
mgnify:CR=1 FL=1